MAEPHDPLPTAPAPPRAVSSRLSILKTRGEFLRVARGPRIAARGFVLQANKRPGVEDGEDPDPIRVGFTCSKKVGNAVARNRAKRRLREIARLVLPRHGIPGYDYVLIGRAHHTAGQDLGEMQADLRNALAKLHGRMEP